MKITSFFLLGLLLMSGSGGFSQTKNNGKDKLVNVFLGSSGDHGQMSPAASYPHSEISIAPQTYPTTHTGYEHLAKEIVGFTHSRFEGVGCQGSGGILFVKPFLGDKDDNKSLIKSSEQASPGFYQIGFTNGIKAGFVVNKQTALHQYRMPVGKKGFLIDLGHTFNNAFVNESHMIEGNAITGWIEAKTTCHAGTYKVYYQLKFDQSVEWKDQGGHILVAVPSSNAKEIEVKVGISAVDTSYAVSSANGKDTFASAKQKSAAAWNELLDKVEVKGDAERTKLFYSLLYRVIQSPYNISEPDGAYRAIDGSLRKSDSTRYHGWAIWDNYKTQLPLLSVLYPKTYGDIVGSVANLYPYGKRDFAGPKEPSNTVRTEHSMVVLLDALRKGYKINFPAIKDSILAEASRLDFSKPDKSLEASYDLWALSGLFKKFGDDAQSEKYKARALEYKKYWLKDFKDLSAKDVDRMGARSLYQGTIRQYRWAVPFDLKGLVELTGGQQNFTSQLDDFFDNDYFNKSNEPDLQTQELYQATTTPWKYQKLVHQLSLDTVIQHYFNDNSRGIGSFIDRIYKNEPKAYIRTMDDDAGAMSGWFILSAMGIQPACLGWPVYYLNVPFFESVVIKAGAKPLNIKVENFGEQNIYIEGVSLNGKELNRTWLTHDEIQKGGSLVIRASKSHEANFGAGNLWVSDIEKEDR
ncbi:alpha-mannosidase [Pedobacter sp. KBW06]|uniref:glycoside hydrolase domain-containing protein n=1 Tax=Pedobacter sp. KBW06 TaxID=2153359 RepID=UPI000F5B7087|nr:glycoside hydrolase domain-containing protein [Pedobacter sp. KBW06]RQO74494.1 alpha-mannosidase [Pedobacter sp. KBW06]